MSMSPLTLYVLSEYAQYTTHGLRDDASNSGSQQKSPDAYRGVKE